MQRKILGNTHPEVALSLESLAAVLQCQGKLSEAEALQREALAIQRKLLDAEHPDVALTLFGLGRLLGKENILDEAETSLNEAITIQRKILNSKHPNLFVSLNELAAVFEKEGKLVEAASVRHEAAENGDTRSQYALGLMYASGRGVPKDETEADKWYRKAMEQYRKAAGNGDARSLNGIAWFLATCDDSKLRDGSGAIGFADRVVAATSRKDPNILDTLAAAYAEAGQFTNAVRIEQEAITLLHTESEITNYTSRLRLYESNTPYRERN